MPEKKRTPGGIKFSNSRQPRKRRPYDKRVHRKVQTPKKRRLNLRKMIEFKYELDHVLKDLPETVKGTLRGSIIAKADKLDVDSALDFIKLKVEDGTLDENTAERLGRLLNHFSFYR